VATRRQFTTQITLDSSMTAAFRAANAETTGRRKHEGFYI
jgi:hypothetical protein